MWIELTAINGTKVWVNMDIVHYFAPVVEGTGTFLDRGGATNAIIVQESSLKIVLKMAELQEDDEEYEGDGELSGAVSSGAVWD